MQNARTSKTNRRITETNYTTRKPKKASIKTKAPTYTANATAHQSAHRHNAGFRW